MFATPAISDPWRLARPTPRPIEGPRVTRSDVVLIGGAAALVLALVSPGLALALVVSLVVIAAVWHGLRAAGPLVQPLVDGDRSVTGVAVAAQYGIAR